MKKRITVVLLSLLALAGCSGLELQRDLMLKEGHPTPYVDGYIDGCPSGKAAGGNMYHRFTKNVMRFEVDSLYRQGWTDGFEVCRSEYLAWRRSMKY